MGFWNSPSIWANAAVPPYNSADTIIIKHPVAFNNNLIFNSGGYLKIDTAGGLCGHNNITLKSGSKFLMRGILEIDSLLIPGGQVSLLSPGAVTLTCYGILSNGGSLTITCSLIVGPWFTCITPTFQFAGIEENNKNSFIKLFPNPNNGLFVLRIDNEIENGELILINSIGQKIYEQKIIQGTNDIKTNGLSLGLYNYILLQNNQKIANGKLVIE